MFVRSALTRESMIASAESHRCDRTPLAKLFNFRIYILIPMLGRVRVWHGLQPLADYEWWAANWRKGRSSASPGQLVFCRLVRQQISTVLRWFGQATQQIRPIDATDWESNRNMHSIFRVARSIQMPIAPSMLACTHQRVSNYAGRIHTSLRERGHDEAYSSPIPIWIVSSCASKSRARRDQ